MYRTAPLASIDYLIIGHITQDITPNGPVMGGTAIYSALTAQALGMRVGIVTACDSCIASPALDHIPVAGLLTQDSTTFENIATPLGRIQRIHKRAPGLNLSLVPEHWRNPTIVHLAPVANEVDPGLVRVFPNSFVALTPQGWMRAWDDQGNVRFLKNPLYSEPVDDMGNVRAKEQVFFVGIVGVPAAVRVPSGKINRPSPALRRLRLSFKPPRPIPTRTRTMERSDCSRPPL